MVLLLLGCGTAPPTSRGDEVADVIAFLRAVHPAPTRFADAADIDAELRAARARLGDAPDDLSTARELARLLGAFGDAHLRLGRAGGEVDETTQGRLPLVVKRAGAKVFVDASLPEVPRGTEVVAVDGITADALLSRLAAMTTVDGVQPQVRLAEAERRFASLARLELGARAHYRLTLRRPGAEPERVTWAGIDRSTQQKLDAGRHSTPVWGGAFASTTPWPERVDLADGTVLVRLRSFGLSEREAYIARVDAIFGALAAEASLVLDLRGNEGGDRSLGVAVLRHLLDRPFAQWRRVDTRVKAIPAAYRDRVSFPFGPEEALTGFPGPAVDGGWRFEGDPLADTMTPHPSTHRGPLAVFVDDATNSAAVEMLVALLAHRSGVRVIGTASQGGCDRHIGQMPVVFRTLSGRFAVMVSLFDLTMVSAPGCVAGRGITPDVVVKYEEAHFLDGRDPYLEAL